jgi:hypothetical protein
LTGEEIKIVTVPPFAESVSEGDVRWEKGKEMCNFAIAGYAAITHV